MTCPNCKRVYPNDRTHCPFCDTPLISDSDPQIEVEAQAGPTESQLNAVKASQTQASASKHFGPSFAGAILDLIVGGIAVLYALITYSNDTSKTFGGYTYRAPLTSHEIMVIVFGIAGIVCLAIGLFQLSIRKK